VSQVRPLTPSTGTSQPLAGKVALITGGSRGIGRAIAKRFLREGARVATVSRSTASGVSGEVLSLAGDVSSEDDVVDAMHEVERALGRLDVLVNNAAVELEARIDETSVTQWDHVMAVNVRSVFLCTKHALPLLRRAGGGSIINISSIDGFWAEPGLRHTTRRRERCSL
jgi:NAD(P)-dependent dehydrogenase (short-subunit alcohol dehydrogenase family)